MQRLSFYEFVGVFVPGTILILGLLINFQFLKGIKQNIFSIGNLGVFLVVAYVAGHIVQALGNFLQGIWWKLFSGMPTSWPIMKNHGNYLTESQIQSLERKVTEDFNLDNISSITDIDDHLWSGIKDRITIRIDKKGDRSRMDVYNGNYGMFRGISVSFLLLLLVSLVTYGIEPWLTQLFILFALGLSIYRMYRFSKYYAKELFLRYIELDK